MCPLNSEAYKDSLALATDTTVTIGTIDEIQKLHIRSVPLGESPRRIAYQEETSTFGVISCRIDIHSKNGLQPSRPSASVQALSTTTSSSLGSLVRSGQSAGQAECGQEQDVHSLLIVDQHTFEVFHSHQLMQQEHATSILSCKLGDDPTPYYVVGTGFIHPEESEPKSGRIIIFSWADGKLTQVAEKEIKGAAYTSLSFNGKLLASINSRICCYIINIKMKIILGLFFLGLSAADLPKVPKIPANLQARGVPIQPRAVKQVDALPCGGHADLDDGQEVTIESPRYPRKYPNNANCTWEITIPAGDNVEIYCEYFHVKRRDFLEVVNIFQPFNGYAPNGVGASIEAYQADYTMQIRFTSNRRGKGWGFRCQLAAEPAYPETTTYNPGTNNTNTTNSGGETTAAPGTTTTTTAAPSSSTCQCGIPNRSNRIVGGVETEVNEYPWQVALVSPNGRSPFCGGTLISDRHVMTAAHCTVGQAASPSGLRVLLGEHKTDDATQTKVEVQAINDDPLYDTSNFRNDFSILTLKEPVTFSTAVRPICLPSDTSKTYAGQKATVSGWGTLSSGGNQPTVLMEVDVTVTTNTFCSGVYGSGISDINICAMDAGKDSCQGDSGGPLFIQENGRYSLIGVVSYGYGCASPK